MPLVKGKKMREIQDWCKWKNEDYFVARTGIATTHNTWYREDILKTASSGSMIEPLISLAGCATNNRDSYWRYRWAGLSLRLKLYAHGQGC